MRSSLKIFLVDDDLDDKEIIVDAIKIVDPLVQVNFADNGEMALEMLSHPEITEASFPSLIVLDLNMPRMNGLLTLKNLKSDVRLKTIPTIIYSTSINSLDKDKCLKLGAHSYITKPLSFRESIEIAKIFVEICHNKVLY